MNKRLSVQVPRQTGNCGQPEHESELPCPLRESKRGFSNESSWPLHADLLPVVSDVTKLFLNG